MKASYSIVMIGATGAVGKETVKELLNSKNISGLTLLGRSPLKEMDANFMNQQTIDIFKPESYQEYVTGHNTAICTLGVGEPSKITKENFVKIDKTAVLDFAKVCKEAGVQHFELLASVGANSSSTSFYLRTKGELIDELKTLNFERLSIFEPSMILTPTNRYGFSQAIVLNVWPILSTILLGPLKKYRGIKVSELGKAIAKNIQSNKKGVAHLQWTDFKKLQ